MTVGLGQALIKMFALIRVWFEPRKFSKNLGNRMSPDLRVYKEIYLHLYKKKSDHPKNAVIT